VGTDKNRCEKSLAFFCTASRSDGNITIFFSFCLYIPNTLWNPMRGLWNEQSISSVIAREMDRGN
jgi:hypothetical protein